MTKARDLANIISAGAVLADGDIAVSEVTGLHAVASSGAYSSLTGLPTLGTAAAFNVGNGANNIPQLDGSGKLGAIDGSALTGIQGFSYASTLAFGDY
jgi:hypothetical protein